jgi:hypothetical protein
VNAEEFAVRVVELAQQGDHDAQQVLVALRCRDDEIADIKLRTLAARLGVKVSAEDR